MAITSEDIQQQSFKIERRGYDVDEVDVFLEHVSDEVDALNNEIARLQAQLTEAESASAAPAPAAPASGDDASGSEKDARIAELESQLTERKSEDNAIAQALIIAQRTADEIVSKARTDGETIRRNAEEEGQRILDKAGAEKQRIIEQISELTVSREKVREQYQDMLKDFIAASTKRLTEIGGDNTSDIVIPDELKDSEPKVTKWNPSPSTATYTTPTVNPAVASPAPPKPSQSSKDLSGYGDADDSFTFDEID
ncbi:DivIVA domain-containing protein [Anaerotardibacter muris]|uniref:DivIVA domain-containing protein n=1 Tax=Anaerotardibacter muris TaxID=2941505 RepID=UPI00203C6C20|nr:DivIVA domain-containing protein [Anaerotardibacter muris]